MFNLVGYEPIQLKAQQNEKAKHIVQFFLQRHHISKKYAGLFAIQQTETNEVYEIDDLITFK